MIYNPCKWCSHLVWTYISNRFYEQFLNEQNCNYNAVCLISILIFCSLPHFYYLQQRTWGSSGTTQCLTSVFPFLGLHFPYLLLVANVPTGFMWCNWYMQLYIHNSLSNDYDDDIFKSHSVVKLLSLWCIQIQINEMIHNLVKQVSTLN